MFSSLKVRKQHFLVAGAYYGQFAVAASKIQTQYQQVIRHYDVVEYACG
jgi:hypothetical protein